MPLQTCTKCGTQFYGNVSDCPGCDATARGKSNGDMNRRRLVGFVCVGASAIIAINAYIFREPLSLIATAIFFLGGLQLIANIQGKISAVMGGLVFAGLATLGFVVAFSREPVGGSIVWFFQLLGLSETRNQVLAHTLIGAGAVITAALGLWFIYRAFKPRKQE